MGLPVPMLPPHTFAGSRMGYGDAKFVIAPIPFDSSTSWGVGARFGPSAVIEASRHLEPHDIEVGDVPMSAGVFTLPEIEPVRSSTELTERRVEQVVKRVLDDGKVPIVLGGDHSITPGAVRATAQNLGDILYFCFDAHADLMEEFEGSEYSHACSNRRSFEAAKRGILFGVRSMGLEEKHFADDEEDLIVLPAVIARKGPESSLESALGHFEGVPVYLSFDVDFLDPSIMPCTGTPEPGGFGWYETTSLLKTLFSSRRVVAMDFVEFSPCSDRRDAAFLVAKLIYKSIGYALARDPEQ